ncbi:MAG: hypothetical protein U9Q35_16855, partial [Pseudomonadota bacterium]|nr:hypothetical protein [Pseudomonadota bacterium]
RCFKAQAKGQNLRTVHVLPPVHVEVISWPSSRDEFHTQRRRASIGISKLKLLMLLIFSISIFNSGTSDPYFGLGGGN